MTQHDLASILGISFAQIQKYEYGTNRLSVSMSVSICKAFGVHPMYFLERHFCETTAADHDASDAKSRTVHGQLF
ncbi:helix-turn-helix domain-containing protein [Rhizobium sp. LjRoot258]|jgi:transcriptional regulator with XRE-family HTH domain|uniref:helix-turn-helix domain-containing protein n=1 Tax=Rhizobium sp. LjRoot258 TaxID=3342299 RepID=UPI003ECFD68B